MGTPKEKSFRKVFPKVLSKVLLVFSRMTKVLSKRPKVFSFTGQEPLTHTHTHTNDADNNRNTTTVHHYADQYY